MSSVCVNIARPAIPPSFRLPAVRNGRDKARIITCQWGWGAVRAEETGVARHDFEGRDLSVQDDTIVVSELPHNLRTVGVSCCLAIAAVDVSRLAGALVHIYMPEQFAEPLQFAIDALNGDPRDLRLGLSGVLCTFGEKDAQIKAGIVNGIGEYGPIIYNQLGKKGDIALSFVDRTIYNPYDIFSAVKFQGPAAGI